jgi:hypothetical protein
MVYILQLINAHFGGVGKNCLMKASFPLLLLFFPLTKSICGQTPAPPAVPIQDNSFLVEEAYNQEAGVVQHINTFTRLWSSNEWVWTFTQEWPVPNHSKHQLSYTITETKPDPSFHAGFGDVLFNYRYQLIGSGETRVAFAPRLTAIAPTGSWSQGTGYGGAGVQTNLPVSIVVLPRLVAHTNAGATWIPSARDTSGHTATSWNYSAGQSLVWLAHQRFNALLEAQWTSSQVVCGSHATEAAETLWFVPGVRWSHNFKNGLQIVPGVGFIAGAGPSQGDHGVFLYLSFEHPMWHERKSNR